MRLLVVSLLLLACSYPSNHAAAQIRPFIQEETRVGRNATADERFEYMKGSAEVYAMVRNPGGDPLQLHPQPLTRWSNPISGITDGVVVMWTHETVPEVVAQIFLSRTDVWFHEFQSLTEASLTVTRPPSREPIWKPEASIERRELPNAPIPAESPAQRMAQMKQLSRRFTASVRFKANPRKQDLVPYELRCQPRPIYRYGTDQGAIIDGALFSFVQGTNPEVFLLVEAFRRGDEVVYRYGLSPMTGYEVSATLDGVDVWNVKPKKRPFPVTGPFLFLHHQPAQGLTE